MAEHLTHSCPVETSQSWNKRVWDYLLGTEERHEGLQFRKGGMSEERHELQKAQLVMRSSEKGGCEAGEQSRQTRFVITSPLPSLIFISIKYKSQLSSDIVTGLTYTTVRPSFDTDEYFPSLSRLVPFSTATYSHRQNRSHA